MRGQGTIQQQQPSNLKVRDVGSLASKRPCCVVKVSSCAATYSVVPRGVPSTRRPRSAAGRSGSPTQGCAPAGAGSDAGLTPAAFHTRVLEGLS